MLTTHVTSLRITMSQFFLAMSLSSMLHIEVKACIPLRRKTIRIGSWRWLGPLTPQFCITYTNMLVSKNAKKNLHFPLVRMVKFVLPPTPNPKTSQWNIGCVGSPMQSFVRVGHVHFIFLVSISFALGSQFPVEYGL